MLPAEWKSPCYGSHVKKHDTQHLIGRIVFLARGKSNTRHLIACRVLRPSCEPNLFRAFSVGKSQYIYNNHLYFYLSLRHTCITRRYYGAVKFLFSVFRTGWPSCLFTSPCSRNTAQSIFQTLSHQEPGTITLSAGSVLLISCYTSTLSFILT